MLFVDDVAVGFIFQGTLSKLETKLPDKLFDQPVFYPDIAENVVGGHAGLAAVQKLAEDNPAGGLLLSAALACMFTGITEPLEFSFLFVAPALFAVQVILAGSAYMIAHMLNIAVGLTFSGGFLDLFLFGILQGNEKTSWLRILPVGVIYFILYYVIFTVMIKKFNFKTPGREDEDEETKLYTKADVNAKNGKNAAEVGTSSADPMSETITRGLGGKANITGVDCCATRLRLTVADSSKVKEALIKSTGSRGIIIKGQGVQIIYGPQVTVIKAKLETYLETAPDTFEEESAESAAPASSTETAAEATAEAAPAEETVVSTTIISSPITGLATALEHVPDEGFAGKMMGDGAAVTPEDAIICAPEDGGIEGFLREDDRAVLYVDRLHYEENIEALQNTEVLHENAGYLLLENGK